jgi:ACS family D-galactonate transporter-like MFS transporter
MGQAAVLALGPVVIAACGWRAFFWISGFLGVIWLAPWTLSMRMWDCYGETSSIGRRVFTPVELRKSVQLLRNRRMIGVFLGYFAYDYVWYLFLTWMPGYLTLDRKFGAREMAIYSSAPYFVAPVVVIIAGILGDSLIRLGWNEITARKSLITAGMSIGCLIIPAGFVEDHVVSAWLLGGAICGLGLAGPNSWALTQAICPKPAVATATGIQNFGGNLGGVVAPALTGFIAQETRSFAYAFVIAGAILLFGIACYWLLIPKNLPDELTAAAEGYPA